VFSLSREHALEQHGVPCSGFPWSRNVRLRDRVANVTIPLTSYFIDFSCSKLIFTLIS